MRCSSVSWRLVSAEARPGHNKAALIYRRTGNLRAVQLLLGHTKLESTVRYLGIEVDDALAITERTDI
jgi:site-specific recombinase XerC